MARQVKVSKQRKRAAKSKRKKKATAKGNGKTMKGNGKVVDDLNKRRAETSWVHVDKLEPNPWNPNKMDDETYEKEKRSIEDNGFIDAITVRTLTTGPDGASQLQILDGYHRWKAAMEVGLTEVMVTNLGKVSDAKAKQITLLFNDLHGDAEPDKLADLLSSLANDHDMSVEEMAGILPYNEMEIASLVEQFSWDGSAEGETFSKPEEGDGLKRNVRGFGDRKIQIGVLVGTVPAWLFNELSDEIQRSVDSLRSKNVELIMRDWVKRLKATQPEAIDDGSDGD